MAKLFGFLYSRGNGKVREIALSSVNWKALSHPATVPNTTSVLDSALGARDIAVDVTEIVSRLYSLLK